MCYFFLEMKDKIRYDIQGQREAKMKKKKKQIITAMLFCSLVIHACKAEKIKKNIYEPPKTRTEKILVINKYLSTMVEIEKSNTIKNSIDKIKESNFELDKKGQNIILEARNEMYIDKDCLYSIWEGENQILRLLSILAESITRDVPFPYNYELSVNGNTSIYGINAYQLALGFKLQEQESLDLYMDIYLRKLEKKVITVEDILDINLILSVISEWEKISYEKYTSYEEKMKSLLDQKEQGYLKPLINKGTYIHYNPLNGKKTYPDYFTLVIPAIYEKEYSFIFPKEWDVSFKREYNKYANPWIHPNKKEEDGLIIYTLNFEDFYYKELEKYYKDGVLPRNIFVEINIESALKKEDSLKLEKKK